MVTEFSAGNVVAGACNWNAGGGCTVELQYSDDPARIASRSSSGRASDFSGLREKLISLCVAAQDGGSDVPSGLARREGCAEEGQLAATGIPAQQVLEHLIYELQAVIRNRRVQRDRARAVLRAGEQHRNDGAIAHGLL